MRFAKLGKPSQLCPGVHPAIAASADDRVLAAQLELASILEGPSFQGSSRSRAFLRFVVEETLAGREELLKERTIGVAVLGKSPTYDTGADSCVRVRANEVRKRLALHYDQASPKAGIRIELPPGAYIPRFRPFAAPSVASVADAPPMPLRRLAAPTLIAALLALMAIRVGVESGDAFSRFWNGVIAGQTQILVVVDPASGTSVSTAMADAAMPFARLADTLRVPVHVVAAGSSESRSGLMIHMSLKEKPTADGGFRVANATVFRAHSPANSLWVWADNADALRAAAQALTSRSDFPEFR